MPKIKMKCHGFSSGPFTVPSFELRDDEAVTLVMPSGSLASLSDMIDALVGKRPGAVELFGKPIWAEAAVPSRGLKQWFQGYSANNWLRRSGSITASQARDILHRLRIEYDDLRYLAGNPRMFLALEAAWAQRADILIFTTVGSDPLGTKTAFDMVREHLPQCPAIYLSFPYMCQGVSSHNHFPGSTIYDAARASPLAV